MHLLVHPIRPARRGKVHPLETAALSLLTILVCLFARKPQVGLAAAAWMAALTLGWSRVAPRLLARLLLLQLPFLLLAGAGVLFNLDFSRLPDALWSVNLGFCRLSVTAASRAQTLCLLGRAAGSLMAMNHLLLSLPPNDLINLLRQLRVPALLIDLLTLCHRFIFVLLETAATIRVAQLSRGGYSSPARALRSFALLAANLFVNALARGRRLHQAMLGRGYRGRLHGLPQAYRWDPRLLALSLLVLVSLLGVWRWS